MDILLAGLTNVLNSLTNDWIIPGALFAIAVTAILLMWKQKFRELVIFACIAAVAMTMVVGGNALFGKNGNLTKTATGVAKKVN